MSVPMLTVAAVAELLNVSRGAVYRLVEQGRLPVHRIGVGRGVIRISEPDLNAFLEASRECKQAPLPCEAPKRQRQPLRHLRL